MPIYSKVPPSAPPKEAIINIPYSPPSPGWDYGTSYPQPPPPPPPQGGAYVFYPPGNEPPLQIHQTQQAPPQSSGYYNPNTDPVSPIPERSELAMSGERNQHVEHFGRTPALETVGMWSVKFSENIIRAKFVAKVYALVFTMLFICFGIASIFYFVDAVKAEVQRRQWIYWLGYVVFIVTYVAIICCQGVRRTYPANYIAMFALASSMGLMVGIISSYHNLITVLVCMGTTMVASLVISIFALTTKLNLSKMGSCLCLFTIGLLIFGGICFLFGYLYRDKMLQGLLGGAFAILMMLWLAYDTYVLLSGKRHAVEPEEFVFAAVILFVDIVEIFLFLLCMMGAINE